MTLAERLAQLRSLGNPSWARTEVDMARGATPGRTHPMFAGMNPRELALYDRLAWGDEMKSQYGRIPALLSSAVMGGGYEAIKALEEGWAGPPLQALARATTGGIGTAMGGVNKQQMTRDATTSPASMENVLAMLYGAWR